MVEPELELELAALEPVWVLESVPVPVPVLHRLALALSHHLRRHMLPRLRRPRH